MRIKRQELLYELRQFALGGHGLVVGAPGIGKSYLLLALRDLLIENDVLSFVIKIDNAYDSSDDAIATELGIEGNWIETLSNIELRNKHKAVLIFDAFDAARDEKKRMGFLAQIKKAKARLSQKWNLIVSARTYDATKSTDLLRLFCPPQAADDLSKARSLTISELNKAEIAEASDDVDLLKFYQGSTAKLQEILHVPFFLKLLETILSEYTPDTVEEIKQYKSEAQLLDYFWKRKVEETESGLAKQKFLLWFTKRLIVIKSLSLSKIEMLQYIEVSDIKLYEELRSELILQEVSYKNGRVAFAHNIFFDYAVNRLCISHDYELLLAFVSEDSSRAFFLRPSFVFFFTSLWYDDKEIFWSLYKRLADSQKKEIQLFVRLVINSTIASQFNKTEELFSLISGNATLKRNESIRNLLQSLRFVRKKSHVQDINLLRFLSGDLDLTYLFEFSFLLDRAIADVQGDLRHLCGESARNFLSYVLENRKSDARIFFDRIGSSRGVELVSKTFSTDPEQSRNVLRQVFPLLDEPGFDINYFFNLSDDLQYFVDRDPSLVSEIYLLIYNHQETSSERTQMGTSVVMNLVSNRRQDFEMCYFRLEQFFPTFLAASAEIALATGIEIINNQKLKTRFEASPSHSFTFSYMGELCSFYPDYSFIRSERQTREHPEGLGDHIIEFIDRLYVQNRNHEAEKLIKQYIRDAKVGFLWRLLIEFATGRADQMYHLIFPLVTTPKFLSAPDVSYDARAFIGKVNSTLTPVQHLALELAIFEAYPDGKDHGIQAALSVLKPESLQTERAKTFMANRQLLENKRPVQSSFSISPYTTEDWLSDQGVDMEDAEIGELTSLVNYLEAFTSLFYNRAPNYGESKPHLDAALDLWKRFNTSNTLPEGLRFTILKSIAETVAIVSRELSEISEKEIAVLKEIVTYAFNYTSEYDIQQKQVSPANGFSPTPRMAATEALPLIFIRTNDMELLSLYKDSIADANSIVRFNAIRWLRSLHNGYFDEYRQLLFDRFEHESDPFNYSVLFSALSFKSDTIAVDGAEIMKFANRKTDFFEHKNSFADSYSEILLFFLGHQELEAAAFATLANGYQYRAFSNSVIFRLFKQIRIDEPREVFVANKTKISSLLRVADNYIQKAGAQLTSTNEFKDDPKVEDALKTFDEVVMRMYFALASNERINASQNRVVNEENKKDLYFQLKPLIEKVLTYSSAISDSGVILAHTAHYLMQTLNGVISFDAKAIIAMVAAVTRYSMQTGYTFDSFSIREIVSLTEKLMADHRDVLLEESSFQDLLTILEIHVHSGWVDALELLWKLDDIFK